MNLFEGRLTLDEADQALVECDGLPARFWLDHWLPSAGPPTPPFVVALRPEKIELQP